MTPSIMTSLHWEELSDVLSVRQIADVLQIKQTKRIGRVWRSGQVPALVIRSGRILRWRKEDILRTLERRATPS